MTAAQYVYAIGRELDPAALAALAGLAGIDGAAVGQIAHRHVIAIASAAPSDETALRARLERLDELATLAKAHEAVVAAVAALTVIAPLRLATIYQNEQRVHQMLRHRHDEFDALLDRLAGMVEVGVKLYLDNLSPDRAAPSSSGRAYLQQLSQRHQRRDEDWRNAAAAVQRIDTALAAHALDRSHHRPQPAQLSGAAGHNVLNAAYLIPNRRVTEFAELAQRLATQQPNIHVEVTGPWAPYSFATPDTGDRS
ncbi:MAG TPA: GvpL/GvpF family gas vesicle protein [Candidatus Limnocylindrales bacterium]|nr:GvpL/GvpF family gas vesicle protein [Candidatus Limnocylindrales bacterium]